MSSIHSNLQLMSSSMNMNCFRPWNYSTDSYHSYLIQKPNHDESIFEKFQYDTSVKLETGQIKNIQQLTLNDFLISIKQSQQYSSLLARVEYIGDVNKITGKVELRISINGIQKLISYYVLQEMPFFVHQYSCWSSISPEYTHHICGLNCRQLECGDIILAITEQEKISKNFDIQPDYTQQSPTKCLVERYMNEKISSTKEHNLTKK